MPSIGIPHTPNQYEGDSYSPVGYGRRGRPMLFQATDPINRPLWEYLLALHTNPNSFSEKFAKSKNVVMTYGGFVEFIWPDELDTISASHSTGAFLGPFTGLTAGSEGRPIEKDTTGIATKAAEHGRHGSIAWERQEDLLEVFRHNGNIFNGRGQPAVRGRIMCIYDRGVYIGHFTTFNAKEADDKSFSFTLDWEFKVEETLYHFPVSGRTLDKKPAGVVFPSELERFRRGIEPTIPTPQQQVPKDDNDFYNPENLRVMGYSEEQITKLIEEGKKAEAAREAVEAQEEAAGEVIDLDEEEEEEEE